MGEINPTSLKNLELLTNLTDTVLDSYQEQVEKEGHLRSIEAYAMATAEEILKGLAMRMLQARLAPGGGVQALEGVMRDQMEYTITCMLKIGMAAATDFDTTEELCRCYLDGDAKKPPTGGDGTTSVPGFYL
jgi:hypothetical protein